MVSETVINKIDLAVKDDSAGYLTELTGLCPNDYKQTDVGLIPKDWKVFTLAEICSSINDGTHHTPRYVNDGVPFYSVENVTANDFNNVKYITKEEHQRLIKRCKPEKGDILLTRIGSLGDTKLIDWDIDASIYVSLALLKLNQKILPDYLYAYSKSRKFVKDVEKRALVNATPQKINMGDIGAIPIPAPANKKEQQAIATALSDVDALIASLEKLIAKKRAIKTATMQQLLTGKKRLPGFEKRKGYNQTEIGNLPNDWGIEKISKLASITTGSRNTQDKVDDGQYPFFVRSKIVERINSYSYDGEAVLTAGDGVGTGKIFHYINGKFDLHQRAYKISDFDPGLDGFYFYTYFSNNFYNRIMAMTAKSSVDSVRMEIIADMLLPLPGIKEQKAISEVLSDLDAEINILDKRLDKIGNLKQGMMQELLTGRTRLV